MSIVTTHQELKDEVLIDLAKDFGSTAINNIAVANNTLPNSTTINFLKAVELHDFLAMQFPPRELILDPWLPTSGLCMVHAKPGIGKTHLALGVAYAVVSGGEFLGWRAPKPRGVLYIDGEMPGHSLQDRLASVNLMHGHTKLPARLELVTPDLQELGMPDLATPDGQRQINELITDDIELVIVDNLSCLVRSGKENDSESWLPIQSWALGLRAKGKSVLFIHHAGKGGTQRGSSKKEDVLDSIISLKRPEDYTQDQGARFIVTFEKARGFLGEDAKPFETQLITDAKGQRCWVTKSLEETNYEKVVSMLNDGMSQKDISNELGINKSNVCRYAGRAHDDGLLNAVRRRNHD